MSGYRVLRRVLVANRGEIAVRVIRTCRRLGIETVLTVSDADAGSLAARLADQVVPIGPAPASTSYLNVDAVVRAAVAAGADAVHPGYGFLSENARLARACAAAGIAFIGPAPETLEAAGDKLAAREHAVAAGLPVLPGGHVNAGSSTTDPPGPGLRSTAGQDPSPGITGQDTAKETANTEPDAAQETGTTGPDAPQEPENTAPDTAQEPRTAKPDAAQKPGTTGPDTIQEPENTGPGTGQEPGGTGAVAVLGAGRRTAGTEAGASGPAADAATAGGTAGSAAADARALARRIGFPVLVKAAGGGGGRGLRVVRDPAELEHAVAVASAEAGAAFADERVYLERYVERGRHVEVQVLGDGEHVVHLGDRDCSVQRRYQKLIEEAPAPGLGDGLRGRLRTAAVALGEHLRYRGAGTVEFLVDADRDEFYFLEVNARIQVEHPVTEAVTGIDIVAEQIAIAEGRPLRLKQEDVTFAGHAIEVRLNAEDPGQDFRPSPGTVTRAAFPVGTHHPIGPSGAHHPVSAHQPVGAHHEISGDVAARSARHLMTGTVRVDTHVQAGTAVPPYYDSLLAKVIGHGADRDDALAVVSDALARCAIDGVSTNLDLHRALLADPEFAAGGVDTGYLARWLARADADPGSSEGMDSAGPGDSPGMRVSASAVKPGDNAGRDAGTAGSGDGTGTRVSRTTDGPGGNTGRDAGPGADTANPGDSTGRGTVDQDEGTDPANPCNSTGTRVSRTTDGPGGTTGRDAGPGAGTADHGSSAGVRVSRSGVKAGDNTSRDAGAGADRGGSGGGARGETVRGGHD